MKCSLVRWLGLFLVAACFAVPGSAGEFRIRDGDRVVFLGDSITEQRLYTTYIEAYTLTRHPRWSVTFRNVGWGGDTAWLRQRAHPDEAALFAADAERQQAMVRDAVRRGLERDVLPLRPTLVTVKFGMNDHAYQPFREDIFRAYVRSQAELAGVLAGAGAGVVFLTPQPIEDKRPDPDQDVRNQSLRKFSDGLRDVAGAAKAGFIDQFDPYLALMLRARTTNPAAFIGGGDSVHPGPAGHTLMAWVVLKGLGAEALVSRVALDAAAGRVTATERCRVENLEHTDGVLAFDRLDEALPMPLDGRAEAALKLAPIMDELSRYELQVSGLPAGDYLVSIDGETVSRLSHEELARGKNLGQEAGAITRQSRAVLDLVFQKNDVYFRRWREVQLHQLPAWAQNPASQAGREAELAALDARVAELEAQIRARSQPSSHRFTIRPAEAAAVSPR